MCVIKETGLFWRQPCLCASQWRLLVREVRQRNHSCQRKTILVDNPANDSEPATQVVEWDPTWTISPAILVKATTHIYIHSQKGKSADCHHITRVLLFRYLLTLFLLCIFFFCWPLPLCCFACWRRLFCRTFSWGVCKINREIFPDSCRTVCDNKHVLYKADVKIWITSWLVFLTTLNHTPFSTPPSSWPWSDDDPPPLLRTFTTIWYPQSCWRKVVMQKDQRSGVDKRGTIIGHYRQIHSQGLAGWECFCRR